MVDLVIINPGVGENSYRNLSELRAYEPPIWAGMTAEYARSQGLSVQIVDADVLKMDSERTAKAALFLNPRLIHIIAAGTTPSVSSTPKMPIVVETVRRIKELNPDQRVSVGGLHPSALPAQTIRETHADYVVRGVGFDGVVDLLTKHRGKCLKYPSVAWDLLPMERYRAHNWHCLDDLNKRSPYAAFYTSYGCPHQCSFCNISELYGCHGIVYRSVEDVVDEITTLVLNYGIRNIKFADELFLANTKRVVTLCNAIAELGFDLNIWAYARTDTVNPTALTSMKKAGIRWVGLGIESASESVRQGVGKKLRTRPEDAVKAIHKAGMWVNGNFIFGLPDDTMETMKANLKMAKSLKMEFANFYCNVLYPGSRDYNDAITAGVKLPQDWECYAQYSPKTMPAPSKNLISSQVLNFRDYAFHDYFSDPDYLERIERIFGSDAAKHIREMVEVER